MGFRQQPRWGRARVGFQVVSVRSWSLAWAGQLVMGYGPLLPGVDGPARPHQGIAQHVPDGERDRRIAPTDLDSERIRRKSVLYGLINEYTRAA